MQPPPRTWPDGRPVGGENGYPPEFEDWKIEGQCRFVAREMRNGRDKTARAGIFDQWKKTLPGITRERVAEIWQEDRKRGRR